MVRVKFKLSSIAPKFVYEHAGIHKPFDVQMRELGFKSAEFHEEFKEHSLSEEEYTWFVLRWSS